jgi:hypothetical protein
MTAFTTPEPITATLTTAGAHVRIAASERPDTVVRVEPVNSASKSDVKVAEQTEVAFADGQLTIKTNKPGAKNGSVAITVELPAGRHWSWRRPGRTCTPTAGSAPASWTSRRAG